MNELRKPGLFFKKESDSELRQMNRLCGSRDSVMEEDEERNERKKSRKVKRCRSEEGLHAEAFETEGNSFHKSFGLEEFGRKEAVPSVRKNQGCKLMEVVRRRLQRIY